MEQAYRSIYEAGGWLLRLNSDKSPVGGSRAKGWQKQRANLGAVLGHASGEGLVGLVHPAKVGLAVVDCDLAGSEEMAVDALGVPLARAKTRGKHEGCHLFFPAGSVTGKSKWAGGEVLAGGEDGHGACYVVLWEPLRVAEALGGRESWPQPPDFGVLPGLRVSSNGGPSPVARARPLDREALNHVSPPAGYDDWIAWLAALKALGFTLEEADEWSRRGEKYEAGEVRKRWEGLRGSDNAEAARERLLGDAAEAGWVPSEDAAAAAVSVEESAVGGMKVSRDDKGLYSAIRQLGLDVRVNARSKAMEVRHDEPGSDEGRQFYATFGLRPDPLGWANFNTRQVALLRFAIKRNFRDTNGKQLWFGEGTYNAAIDAMLAGREVDPVAAWLDSLPEWDGVERVPAMFQECLGATDTKLNRAAAVSFMVGIVHRTRNPGCKHDWIPVLVSGQGEGKSTFAEAIFPPGYDGWHVTADRLDRDARLQAERIGGAAVVEFAELRGIDRWDFVKNYLSARGDQFRAPWGRQSEYVQRCWVGIGTANDDGRGVLPADPTGSRRYVVVGTDAPGETQDEKASHVRAWWAKNREQVFAEAKARQARGEKSYLAGEFERERDDVNYEQAQVDNEPLNELARRLTEQWSRMWAEWENPQDALRSAPTMVDLLADTGLLGSDRDGPSQEREAVVMAKTVGRELARHLRSFEWQRRRIRRGVVWIPPKEAVRGKSLEFWLDVDCPACNGGELVPIDPEREQESFLARTLRKREAYEAYVRLRQAGLDLDSLDGWGQDLELLREVARHAGHAPAASTDGIRHE
ncbi:MAG: PriCT-2 domain-containing protein [Cyanobacteria bacterium MAG COS4_bin_21]|nr:PriCT-2 domain-containing protein [Cyanobacteria bacterium MAG COS4_bin_21]